MTMHSYWIYVSRADVPAKSADDVLIFLQAFNRNTAGRITGYLHREANIYAQFIEGPKESLDAIRSAIRRDRRHMVLRTVAQGETADRSFAGWDMAFSRQETVSYRNFALARGFEPQIEKASAVELVCFMQSAVSGGLARDVSDLS